MNNVGDRIRQRRSELGLTQERLAELARLSKGFISEVESGKRSIGAESLLSISLALGVSLDYLMKGSDETPVAAELHIPGSLSNFAQTAQLSFRETVTLLRLREQLQAHHGNEPEGDAFDWRQLHEKVKGYL